MCWPWVVALCVRALVREGRVHFTHKARREIRQLELALDVSDALEVLAALTPHDKPERVRSEASGEMLYVFRPRVAGVLHYVKLALRSECVVISFHEEAKDGEESREDSE